MKCSYMHMRIKYLNENPNIRWKFIVLPQDCVFQFTHKNNCYHEYFKFVSKIKLPLNKSFIKIF